MKQKDITVVGGGIAGITAAYFYKKKGYRVHLIEKDPMLGGLLRSKVLFNGLIYDYGTHFLRQTGIAELDQFLFDGLKVIEYPYLKVGSYFQSLYEKNSFITDFDLSNRDECFAELLNITSRNGEYENLKSQLIGYFGKCYAENLLFPAIEKNFRTRPEELIPDAHKLFGLSRIIAGDEATINNLKKQSKELDNVLAFHSYLQGISSLMNYYPTENGAGRWIEHLERKLFQSGVEILKNSQITSITINHGRVEKVQLNGNQDITTDMLVWTIPLFPLLSMLNLKVEAAPPKRLTSVVYDFETDLPYNTDVFYFQNFHPGFHTFRVTLYDNFSTQVSQTYRITSEVLIANQYAGDLSEEIIFDELKSMQVIPQQSQLLNSRKEIFSNSFPILTQDFINASELQYECIKSNTENVVVHGRSAGKLWFMNEILQDVYQKIMQA